MAGAGQSKASHRRELQSRADATQERVTLIALGVLAAVVVLIIAGVIWGVVLPPRAHVLTVGDAKFNAGQVEKRAEFIMRADPQGEANPVDAALNMLRRHETLLQAGAAEAGEITADDLEKAIWTQIKLPPESSKEEYAKAYENYLRTNNVDKATFDRMMRADVIYKRLSVKVLPQVGENGTQLHLLAVVSRDQNKLKQFRDSVAGGADFAAKAIELGIVQKPESVDLGWHLPPSSGFLKDAKLDQLQARQMTEVVTRDGGLQFEIYRVAEREDKRAYTDEQKTTLSNLKTDEWIAAQADKVKITEDLSDGERAWITDRLTKAARKIAEEQAKAGPGPITVTK